MRRTTISIVLALPALCTLSTGCAAHERAPGTAVSSGPVAPGPTLTIPFRLRDHDGLVSIAYETNRDPTRWGFDLIGLPFDTNRTIGFPTFDATVRYDARGYRALMGWIQLVTVHDAKSGRDETSVDQLPILRDSDTPFFAIGTPPNTFDAPGPNPPRTDEVWTAYSFLAICPDIGKTRHVAAILGVRWGYTLVAGRATPSPLEQVSLREWDRLVPVLRKTFPEWAFVENASP